MDHQASASVVSSPKCEPPSVTSSEDALADGLSSECLPNVPVGGGRRDERKRG